MYSIPNHKMKLKLFIAFPLFLAIISMASCSTDSTSTTDTVLSSDAQITSYKLVADANKGINLGQTFFTIDQQTNQIYNADSLPVGTKVDSLMATISFASASKVQVQYEGKEFKDFKTTDSLNYKKPFKMKVVAYNGTDEKIYTVKLNVHTVDPEAMPWSQLTTAAWNSTAYLNSKTVLFKGEFVSYLKTTSAMICFKSTATDGIQWALKSNNIPADANLESITLFNDKLFVNTVSGSLYSSDNGENWVKSGSETGFFAILGTLTDISNVKRIIVIKSVASNTYATSASTDGVIFAACGDAVLPDDFPIQGFSSLQNVVSGTNRLTVLVGRDKNNQLLGTVQQFYWDLDGLHSGYNINNHFAWFRPRQGANAFLYDGKLVLTCGQSQAKKLNDTWVSKDHGVSWINADSIITQSQDTIARYPAAFVGRSYASAVVDDNNYIWLFGGDTDATYFDVWRGRINRLGFKK